MEDFKRKLADYLLQQRIKLSYREGRDISQSEIADRVGIPQGTYNKYETGKSPPNDINKHKLAAFWGVEIYRICGGPVPMPDNPSLREVAEVWCQLPAEAQRKFRDVILEAAKEWENHNKPNFNQGVVQAE